MPAFSLRLKAKCGSLLVRLILLIGFTLSAPHVQAATSDLLDSENQGIFPDIGERLPDIEAPNASVKRAAPEACQSGAGEDAFRIGFREAQEGRAFLPSFAFRLNPNWYQSCEPLNTTRPDRIACRGYRNAQGTPVLLPCCETGFRAGIARLGGRIASNLRTAPSDEPTRHCLQDFERGEAFGEHFCPLEALVDSCHIPPRACLPTRYLNCFHLGVFSKMSRGGCSDAETVSQTLRQVAPSLSPRHSPAERGSGLSLSPTSSSADRPAQSGGRAE